MSYEGEVFKWYVLHLQMLLVAQKKSLGVWRLERPPTLFKLQFERDLVIVSATFESIYSTHWD